MMCDKSKTDPLLEWISEGTTTCEEKVRITAASNCDAFNINALWRWCDKFWWMIGLILFGLGLFQWTLGHKLVKPTIFSIILLTVFSIIMLLFYAIFLPRNTKEWTIWVIGGVGLILGGIAGYFLTKLVRIGIAALGAWVGVIISLLIHEAFMYAVH